MTLRGAQQALDLAGGIVDEVAGRLGVRHGHDGSEVVDGEVVPEPGSRAAAPSAPVAPVRAPARAAPARAPEPLPPQTAHVSSEPELVGEFAEPSAEDGAGAEVHIGEPWPGYRHLKARDVIARLPGASREELAAVELFERAHANRKSVVAAAQRALMKASPPR